jgi:glycosyltransferase involved in cell wall biosynthesis
LYVNVWIKMKILVISSRIPAVEKKGDQVVSFFRIMHLVRTHEVELICFGNEAESDDREAKQVLEEAGIVVHFVRWNPLVALVQLLKAILNSQISLQCTYFRSGEFQSVVEAVCTRFMPDLMYCVMIRTFANAASFKGPIYVDMVDSMGLNFSRRASMTTGLKRWLLNIECSRVSAFESSVAQRAVRSFVVSRIDKNAITCDKVDVIPLGIDMQRFSKCEHRAADPVIAFTGNMFYQPNVDAVLWFVQNCWSGVKDSVPGARMLIVGSNPRLSVQALGKLDKTIVVLGRVPSVASILNSAMVAIAPMQSGSGMQFKILEAMACGVPVVTTTLGLGDISATPGQDLLVADSPAEFSKAVVDLLKSQELAADVGEHGMQYVQSNHSWDALNERFEVACGIKKCSDDTGYRC